MICRICSKEVKLSFLQNHSDLCKEKEELKKESKGLDDQLMKLLDEASKGKKHFALKIQMLK
jgi:hypothetical protein